MSLFTALVPSVGARDHLAAAVGPVRTARPELRWVRPERWHTTVVFLGEVGDEVVPGLVAATRAAVADVPAPRLRLEGAGRFPPGGARLRVLWVGVRGDLGRLVGAAEDAARSCGVELQEREHVPHLTLARAARPCRVGPGTADPVAALASYTGPVHTVRALSVLRSRPGRPGPYEVVADLPLRPPEDAAGSPA